MKELIITAGSKIPESDQSVPASNAFDVVVVSHGRNNSLIQLIQSFCSEDTAIDMVGKFVVVVDSRPLPDISGLCLGTRLTLIAPEKRVFITSAKNMGWHECTSDLILFVDDDNVVNGASLKHLVHIMNNNPSVGAVMPSVSYYHNKRMIWVYSPVLKPGKWRMSLIGRNTIEDAPPTTDLIEADALPNAFMVRRSVLEEIGGFDAEFRINNSCDLCQRIKARGYGTFASTRARFYHDVVVPGTLGYWAEHATQDLERSLFESRDWVILMRRLHPGIRFWNPVLSWHFMLWVSQVTIGLILLGSGHRKILANLLAYSRGFILGWKDQDSGS